MHNQAYSDNFLFEDIHWWYQGRLRIVLELLLPIFSKKGNSTRVLDYGCGTGLTLKIISDRATAIGVDQSETSISYCRRRGLDNAYLLKNADLSTHSPFDVILMLDVLEHIDDSVGKLNELRELLASDGSILITVPAYQFLWGDEDILSMHKRRYTLTQLRRELELAGFKIVKGSYFNMFLLPLISVFIFGRRFLGGDQRPLKSNAEYTPSAVNVIFRTILTVESFLLRWIRFPMGASIVVVAQKRGGQ